MCLLYIISIILLITCFPIGVIALLLTMILSAITNDKK